MSVREPGLFTKEDMKLSIYVDDSAISGPGLDRIQKEMEAILKKFPGKIVPPRMEGDVEVRDWLGAVVRYNRGKRQLSITMEPAIDKLLKQFNMADCKSVATPCVVSNDLSAGKPNTHFPIRQAVGSLLYIATVCRCDISYAVQRVARCVSNCTEAVIKAVKRILAYLKGTRLVGLEYTPEIERNFYSVYSEIAKKAGKEVGPAVSFSDADFAGCSVSLRSTSGSIMYYKGTPIVWSSRRQSIRAKSTCEAEYVACYDTIRIVQSQGWLDYVLEEGEFPLVFVDNKSALDICRRAV